MSSFQHRLDEYVWEHYREWEGPADYMRIQKEILPLWAGVGHIREYADKREAEHAARKDKLRRIQRFLPDELKSCIDPFIEQQAKLQQAYFSLAWNVRVQLM